MELEYSDKNSKRSKLYIAVGLVIALIVGGLVFVALRFSNVGSGDTAVEELQVVVAARSISSRKPIEEGDLVMRTVAADPTNATAYARIDQVLGRITGVPVAPVFWAATDDTDFAEASWTQVVEMLEFMADATRIPILLDGDTGYGNFNNMRRLVRKIEQRGIADRFLAEGQVAQVAAFADQVCDPIQRLGPLERGASRPFAPG